MSYGWYGLRYPNVLGQNLYPYYTWSPWALGWGSNRLFSGIPLTTDPYIRGPAGFPPLGGYTSTPYHIPYQYQTPLQQYPSNLVYPQAAYSSLYPNYNLYTPSTGYQQPYQQQIPQYSLPWSIPQYPYYAPQYGY